MIILKHRETWGWQGRVKITVWDLAGVIIDVVEFDNLITTVGLNMVRDGLYGDVADAEIKYLAYGDDNTAPVVADTTLGNEVARKARTSQSKPAAGQQTYTQYIDPTEWIDQIEELGWFAGATAGAGADSGIMVSHVLYPHNKTALESLQIERTDTFGEV